MANYPLISYSLLIINFQIYRNCKESETINDKSQYDATTGEIQLTFSSEEKADMIEKLANHMHDSM